MLFRLCSQVAEKGEFGQIDLCSLQSTLALPWLSSWSLRKGSLVEHPTRGLWSRGRDSTTKFAMREAQALHRRGLVEKECCRSLYVQLALGSFLILWRHVFNDVPFFSSHLDGFWPQVILRFTAGRSSHAFIVRPSVFLDPQPVKFGDQTFEENSRELDPRLCGFALL